MRSARDPELLPFPPMMPLIDETITQRLSRATVAGAIAFALMTASCTPGELHTAEARAVVAFKDRVVDYIALHKKLEATLPKIPDDASPQEIDSKQRALGELIKSARSDAKPGEFFSPEFQTTVRRVLKEILSGPGGSTVKGSIMDENPGVPQILINERYPSSVPLSTMPPQLLEALPKLKGELEYRFLGPRLVLVDTEAQIILDFTDEVLPR